MPVSTGRQSAVAGGLRANWSMYRHSEVGAVSCLRLVLSILLPPVGVFLTVGFGLHFWLNILLTILGYFPGLVHAVWVIFVK